MNALALSRDGRGNFGSETRQYNAYGQLTQLSTGSFSETYNYSLTQNDGRVTSIARSGEEVVYQYDALQRLVRAETVGAGGWGMSWTYDGWGNRTSQGVVKGTVPVNSVSVDPATNRMQGWTYDANGNVTWTSETSWITYDASNRIKSMQFPVAESYEYDPSNKRIWKTTTGGEVFTFWGGRGERIGRYAPEVQVRTIDGVAIHKFVWVRQSLEDVYFGGKRLQATDRLGSVGGGGRYYPYGEERSATAEGTDKFATYHRDATGFDYADQRYYSSKFGRFLTSDPYVASGGPAAPGSWNRYAYVEGDPANFGDPTGRIRCRPHDNDWDCEWGPRFPGLIVILDYEYLLWFDEEFFGQSAISREEVQRRRSARLSAARAAVSAAAAAFLERRPGQSVSIPTTIRVVDDCRMPSSTMSVSETRFVTYEILDQTGNRMVGSALDEWTIAESFPYEDGNLNLARPGQAGAWSRANGGISASGRFVDLLSANSGIGGVVRSGTALQQFIATGPFGLSIPLRIEGFGGITTILQNVYGPNAISINGTRSGSTCRREP